MNYPVFTSWSFCAENKFWWFLGHKDSDLKLDLMVDSYWVVNENFEVVSMQLLHTSWWTLGHWMGLQVGIMNWLISFKFLLKLYSVFHFKKQISTLILTFFKIGMHLTIDLISIECSYEGSFFFSNTQSYVVS